MQTISTPPTTVQDLKTLGFHQDEIQRLEALKEGYDPYSPPAGLLETTEYCAQEDPQQLVLRTGFLLREGKSYGVLQIYTYNIETITSGADQEETDFFAPIRTFIKKLNHKFSLISVE